jgi:uncharacterized protein involved in response to NO
MLGRAAQPEWHWRHVLVAPHRLGFLLAMIVLAASGVWWFAVQLDRSGFGPGLSYAVSPSLVHAALMTFGFMPLFFCGFLFTAGPRWLGVRGPQAITIAPALLAYAGGWLLWLAGSHLNRALAATGLALAAVGLTMITMRFARLVAASREPDRMHPMIVGLAFAVGCLCLAGVAASVMAGADALARLFVLTALWGFVVVVFVTVANRMIPFFGSSAVPIAKAWPESWVLWVTLGAAFFEAVAVWVDAFAGDPPNWRLFRGVMELAASVPLVGLAVAWGLVHSFRIRLMAMLHLGFLWLGLSLALSGVSQLLGWAAGTSFLPLAPLHAMTMGCLGSLMLAMVSRVTCAHTGRPAPVVADNLVWSMFLLLQVATLLRIAATVPDWPGQPLLTIAALLWSGLTLIWGGRYGAWYGRPSTSPLRR